MVVTKDICDQLDDAQVVKKALADIDYFSCLYEKYEPRLLRYIKRITLFSNEEAEDILQEAFIKIWKNLNNYDPRRKLSSWLYRIVHNETVSCWRKKQSYGKDRTVALDERMSEGLSNELTAEDLELNDQLTHEVLQQLPIKYQTVLVLKYLEGMHYEEISDILKIPEGTVATLLNRARKAFARIAEEQHIDFAH